MYTSFRLQLFQTPNALPLPIHVEQRGDYVLVNCKGLILPARINWDRMRADVVSLSEVGGQVVQGVPAVEAEAQYEVTFSNRVFEFMWWPQLLPPHFLAATIPSGVEGKPDIKFTLFVIAWVKVLVTSSDDRWTKKFCSGHMDNAVTIEHKGPLAVVEVPVKMPRAGGVIVTGQEPY